MNDKALTPRAHNVLRLAYDEADRLGHSYIGTEHLLLAILREGGGIGANLLESQGVKLDKMRVAVEFICGRGMKK